MRWDANAPKYKLAFKDEPLTLAYLMFPFPAITMIKNVFTNKGFLERGHGHRISLQTGESSAQNKAG